MFRSRTFQRSLPLAALLAVSQALAGTNLWTKGIGADANISSLAANPLVPNVIYASSGATLLKSGDGGNHWSSLQKLLSEEATLNLVLPNPQAPDYVFVGQSAWGIGRSIYGGKDGSWRMQNGSAPYTAGDGFSCPIPSAPPLIYNFDGTVDDDQVFDLGPDEAVGGGDDDITLTPLFCPDSAATGCHAYPPVAGDYILYGPRPAIGGYDIAGRINAYCTNPAIPHAGNPDNAPHASPPGAVTALAFARNNGNIGFAAFQGKGIFTTDNALRTVFCPYKDPDSNNTVNGIDPDLPWVCSAYDVGEPDLWSWNYRVNWGTGSDPLLGGPELALSSETVTTLLIRESTSGNYVYAGLNGSGVRMRSGAYNTPGSWTLQSCGAAGDIADVCNVQTLALSPDQNQLWAGTLNNGLWRANVSAGTPAGWARVDNLAAGHACYSALRNVRALAFANLFDSTTGSSKTRVYAGSYGQGICISEDDGASWASFNDGLTDPASGSLFGLYVTAIAVDPFNPARVYAGTFAGVYSIQTINGGVGGLTLAPNSLAFGAIPVGQSSALSVNLTAGSQDVGLAELSVPAGYTVANGCGEYVPAGSACPLTVTFTPTAATSYGGSLLIRLSGATTPLSVPLSGSGTASSTSLTVTPTALAFGNVAIGQSSLKTLTVNAGASGVALTEVTAPAGFEVQSGCGDFVPASASCLISVIFKPELLAPYGGSLLLRTSASSAPIAVPLSGNGSAATATPLALKYADGTAIINETHDFGTIARGGQSEVVTFMLNAPEPLDVPTPVTGNPEVFPVVAQNCNRVSGIDLLAGQSCTFSLRYKPAEAGADEAFLILSPVGASQQPYSVFLNVKGAGASNPGLTVSPTSLAFGNVAIGQSSLKTLTFTAGASGVALSELTVPTGFETSSGCGDYIPAGASCLINVVFAPTLAAPYGGSLLLRTAASSTPMAVSLSGNGSSGSSSGTSLTLDSTRIDFGTLRPGSSLSRSILLGAAGGSLTLSSVEAPNGYSATHSCGNTLPAGGRCEINVSFNPDAFGSYQGSLLIYSNATGSPHSVTLSGRGADVTSLSGAARGNASAYDLTGHFRFSEWDARGGGYYYVFYERDGARYFFNGRSWIEAGGEYRPPFVKAGRFSDFDVLIFNAANVRALSGASVFLGYGSNQDDMLNNFKFSQIAILP